MKDLTPLQLLQILEGVGEIALGHLQKYIKDPDNYSPTSIINFLDILARVHNLSGGNAFTYNCGVIQPTAGKA